MTAKLSNEWVPTPFAVGTRAGLNEIAKLEVGEPLRIHVDPIETGLETLDHILGGGLRPGEITVIGAQSGHGKSALAEQIALHSSRRARTTYFGLELGYTRTRDRMLAKLMRTDLASVHHVLEQNPMMLRKQFETMLYDRSLIIEERLEDEDFICDMMVRMILANRPKLIVIDHLRHLDDWLATPGKGRADVAPANLARRLVKIARGTDAHIIAVHQLKAYLGGKKPTMSDLADTYALAQVADAVLLVHRPFRGQGPRDNVAELIVDKNRNGPEGLLHLHWRGRLMRYDDMTADEEQDLPCCATRKH